MVMGEAKLQLREEGTTWSWGHSWAGRRTKPSGVGGGAVRCLGKWEEREGKLAFADLRQLCVTTLGDECYNQSHFISGETEAHVTL